MDKLHSSLYRRLQAAAARFLKSGHRIQHLGFDTRICGRSYSVTATDYKGNTFAILIYANDRQAKEHRAEILAARGKFTMTSVVVPKRKMGCNLYGWAPRGISVLIEDRSWRKLQTYRYGHSFSDTYHRRISTNKVKECIGYSNSDLLKDLTTWMGDHPGKNIDDSVIESLKERGRNILEEAVSFKAKAEEVMEKHRGIYNFLSRCFLPSVLESMCAAGSRMAYKPFSEFKDPKNSDKNMRKNGFCETTFKNAAAQAVATFKKLDNACKKCKINKDEYTPILWADLNRRCAKCEHIAAQGKLVSIIYKADAFKERQTARATRKL